MEIQVRSLTGAEIDKFANSDKIGKKDPMGLKYVEDSITVLELGPAYSGEAKDFDVKNLLVGDQMAAMISVFVETMGPMQEYDITCPECEAEFMVDVDISQLQYRPYTEEVCKANCEGELLKIRPMGEDGPEIGFKSVTVSDAEKILKSAKGKKKGERDGLTTAMAQRIKYVEDMDVRSHAVLVNWLKSLDYFDLVDIQEAMGEYDGGVEMEAEVECEECGHDLGKVDLPLDLSRVLRPSKRARGLNRPWKKKMKDLQDSYLCQLTKSSQD